LPLSSAARLRTPLAARKSPDLRATETSPESSRAANRMARFPKRTMIGAVNPTRRINRARRLPRCSAVRRTNPPVARTNPDLRVTEASPASSPAANRMVPFPKRTMIGAVSPTRRINRARRFPRSSAARRTNPPVARTNPRRPTTVRKAASPRPGIPAPAIAQGTSPQGRRRGTMSPLPQAARRHPARPGRIAQGTTVNRVPPAPKVANRRLAGRPAAAITVTTTRRLASKAQEPRVAVQARPPARAGSLPATLRAVPPVPVGSPLVMHRAVPPDQADSPRATRQVAPPALADSPQATRRAGPVQADILRGANPEACPGQPFIRRYMQRIGPV